MVQIRIGSISWIHQGVSPVQSQTGPIDALIYEPEWVPKTYIGLYATKNIVPGVRLDLPLYRKRKQYRAMTFADLQVDVSPDRQEIKSVIAQDEIIDAGYTPPFDRSAYFLTAWMPKSIVPPPIEASMFDRQYHPGEIGAGSEIVLQGRHPSTMIKVTVPQRNLVANALIFFRAGKHTDSVGVNVVKSPYHVPWVWCEWMITYRSGKFTVYGTGSIFPTHSFYVDTRRFGQLDEPMDSIFSTKPLLSFQHQGLSVHNPREIITSALRVYPVLTKGAPARGPQVADMTAKPRVPAAAMHFTVGGHGALVTETF